jgi:hypothetical protein
MENCLVTKLKGSVNNDNLEIFGGLFLYNGPDPGTNCRIVGEKVHASILTNLDNVTPYPSITGDVIDENSRYVPTTSSVLYFTSVDKYKLRQFKVSNKYNITVLDGFCVKNIHDLVYLPLTFISLKTPNINMGKYNLDEFADVEDKTKLTQLVIQGASGAHSYVYGNIATFSDFSNLYDLRIVYSWVEGDLSDVYTLNKLTKLELSYCGKLTGSLDGLASAIASSRSNGSTLAFKGNGVITFKANGDGTGDDTVIANGAAKTITFDGQGGYTIA